MAGHVLRGSRGHFKGSTKGFRAGVPKTGAAVKGQRVQMAASGRSSKQVGRMAVRKAAVKAGRSAAESASFALTIHALTGNRQGVVKNVAKSAAYGAAFSAVGSAYKGIKKSA